MQAARIVRCGQPPVLVDCPPSIHDDGAVPVSVLAAPITPLDVFCASGTSYFGAPAVPYTPGVQGVGVLADGTRVWFATDAGMRPGDGSMAEQAAVSPEDLVVTFDAVPLSEAPAAWLNGTNRQILVMGENRLTVPII